MTNPSSPDDIFDDLGKLETALLQRDAIKAASPDDIRAMGWMVAVHHDYWQDGKLNTHWLFKRGERAVDAEGRTDAEALNQIRGILHMKELA